MEKSNTLAMVDLPDTVPPEVLNVIKKLLEINGSSYTEARKEKMKRTKVCPTLLLPFCAASLCWPAPALWSAGATYGVGSGSDCNLTPTLLFYLLRGGVPCGLATYSYLK